jgi:Uma2 family endonuclease
MTIQTQSLYDVIDTLPMHSVLVIHDVSWTEYVDLLAQCTDNPRFRLSYDQGTLQIMTTSARHERLKALFTPLLTVLAEEGNTNLVSLGSATFRLDEAARGLEPDDCYYIGDITRIASHDLVDLAIDPPPDLVIEIDITHPSLNKLPIYASLQVPEIWRHTGDTLHILRLHGENYQQASHSGVFPQVSAAVLTQFVQQGVEQGIIPMVRAFRDWVRAQESLR